MARSVQEKHLPPEEFCGHMPC
jgi:hypothetical protein